MSGGPGTSGINLRKSGHNMFEFTRRSKRVLEEMSQVEGRRLNSSVLEPEHILIALLHDEDSVAARILRNIGIDFISLERDISSCLEKETGSSLSERIPVSFRYRRIIEISREEAKNLKNSYIGTEHILLAIFRDGTTKGLESLFSEGIDYSVVQAEILRVLGVKVPIEKSSSTDNQSKKSQLDEFSTDLTKMASENMLDPVIGRDSEIDRIIRILSRKKKNNPILIGEAGVGKTALAEGLAQKIVMKTVPASMFSCRVLALDLPAIVAGTKYRGEFEDRLKRIVEAIRQEKDLIIFIDEIHTIIGAGAAEGAIDAANILKPALARGDLQCIGATTLKEYRQHLEKDPALVRRFQPVMINEPGREETCEILRGLKRHYEIHHCVRYDESAIREAVVLSERYIKDRYLPDKAIDLIDEAGATAKLRSHEKPADITALEKRIEILNSRKNALVMSQEYEEAAAVRDEIIADRELLKSKLSDWQERINDYEVVVTASNIASIVAESSGIPVDTIKDEESIRLLEMEKYLSSIVIGQDEAVSSISKAIRHSRAGLSDNTKPLASFLFLGPTGVGKTELAKALSEFLFQDRRSLIRIDMSEYMEKHSVSRLIGSPPGYIGYEDGGQLAEKIRRNPYSVVLLDEVEKAHPDVYNILLQVFDEGVLTDSSGTKVSFADAVIIMTSNAGNRNIRRLPRTGFVDSETDNSSAGEKYLEEMKSFFSPELINRIDDIIVFNKLIKKDVAEIINIQLEKLAERMMPRRIRLKFSQALKSYLLENGFSEDYGARNLKRLIRHRIEDELAFSILGGTVHDGDDVTVTVKNDKVVIRAKSVSSDGKKEAPAHV